MENEKQRPFTYRSGNLKIVEWTNKDNDGNEFKSFGVEKFYKDNTSGEWKTTKLFNYNELLKLRDLITKFDTLKNNIEQDGLKN